MNKSGQTYYDILGISRNASKKEIRAAFAKLSLRYQSEMKKGAVPGHKFFEVYDAYQFLIDDKNRKKYDKYLAYQEQTGSTMEFNPEADIDYELEEGEVDSKSTDTEKKVEIDNQPEPSEKNEDSDVGGKDKSREERRRRREQLREERMKKEEAIFYTPSVADDGDDDVSATPPSKPPSSNLDEDKPSDVFFDPGYFGTDESSDDSPKALEKTSSFSDTEEDDDEDDLIIEEAFTDDEPDFEKVFSNVWGHKMAPPKVEQDDIVFNDESIAEPEQPEVKKPKKTNTRPKNQTLDKSKISSKPKKSSRLASERKTPPQSPSQSLPKLDGNEESLGYYLKGEENPFVQQILAQYREQELPPAPETTRKPQMTPAQILERLNNQCNKGLHSFEMGEFETAATIFKKALGYFKMMLKGADNKRLREQLSGFGFDSLRKAGNECGKGLSEYNAGNLDNALRAFKWTVQYLKMGREELKAGAVKVHDEPKTEDQKTKPPPAKAADVARAKAEYNKALQALKAKDYKTAIASLKWAINLNQNSAIYHAKYAGVLALLGRDLRTAKIEARKAVELDPDNAECHYYLGIVYRAAGLANRAVACFEKALRMKPDHQPSKQAISKLAK